jgi:AraC-like DNA-binding protein
MALEKSEPPRGIIGAVDGVDPVAFAHRRFLPGASLAAFVEHHWSVGWEMAPGTTQARHTLSHPSVHVAFDGSRATVTGPSRGRFTWILSGKGHVFATKFLPGAFRPLLAGGAMKDLVDVVRDLAEVVTARVAEAYVDAARASANDDAAVEAVEQVWAQALPQTPPHDQQLLLRIVESAQTDRSLTRVEQLVSATGLHIRELQRFCDEALGISPRWLIRRYRLHDALAALDAGTEALAPLAERLGYSDQAHFSRDFKTVVGVTPSAYLRRKR